MSDTPNTQTKSQEKISGAFSGAFMLLFNAALLLGGIALLAQQFMASRAATNGWIIIGALGMMLLGLVLLGGFFTLQPNEARVLLLFGSYHGTVRQSGFYWANPFYSTNSTQSSGRIQRPRQRARERAVHPQLKLENFSAGAKFQQREAEGERQARQSG
jgi:hypothetical protein